MPKSLCWRTITYMSLLGVVAMTTVSARMVYETCSVDSECPDKATCRASSCDGYVCLCVQNYVASENRTSCVKAARVGEVCRTGESRCISPFAVCVGKCECFDVFMPTKDGRCKLPGTNFVGEECGKCEFPATCVDGVCRCADEFRPLTTEEFWLDPLSLMQCRPRDYSLNTCNGTNIDDMVKERTSQTDQIDQPTDQNSVIKNPSQADKQTAIFEPCSDQAQCPRNAECKPSACDGFVCTCKEGFIASDNRSRCLRARRIGEACKTVGDRCLSPFAMCVGTCQCMDLFVPTQDGRCQFPGNNHVGESCDSTKGCQYPAVCVSGRCQCEKPFRETTREEFWMDPLTAIQCRPNSYSLWRCNDTQLTVPAGIQGNLRPSSHSGGHGHDDQNTHHHDDETVVTETAPPPPPEETESNDSLLIPLNIAGILAVAGAALLIGLICRAQRKRKLKKHNIGSTIAASSVQSSVTDDPFSNPSPGMKIPRPNVLSMVSSNNESWGSFSSCSTLPYTHTSQPSPVEAWQQARSSNQSLTMPRVDHEGLIQIVPTNESLSRGLPRIPIDGDGYARVSKPIDSAIYENQQF